ncbi:MAG TPA: hypothetical protein VFR31_03835 [Thermoanaerobaculia bacterium]|nr:hypothetical protein [Thermoanaerobaculia bacterium]
MRFKVKELVTTVDQVCPGASPICPGTCMSASFDEPKDPKPPKPKAAGARELLQQQLRQALQQA